MDPTLPDMGKVGEAASKLTDPQSVMFYFLLVLIVVLVIKDIVGSWRNSRTADKFANAADKVSTTIQTSDAQIAVQLALIQREMNNAANDRAEAKQEREKILACLRSLGCDP